LSKEVLKKSKFFSKGKKSTIVTNTNSRKLYTQVTSLKVSDILKLKDNYSNFLAKKIKNIYKIINNMDKMKP